MNPYILSLSNLIIGAAGGLIGITLTHFFSKKRKVSELLFSARTRAYSEFMRNFGMAFGPEKIDLRDFDEIKLTETNYEKRQRINRIFSECRLVANYLLEIKLRHLYDLIIEELNNDLVAKTGKTEKDYIGYEIELLMRYDLRVASASDVIFSRFIWNLKRRELKRKKSTNR